LTLTEETPKRPVPRRRVRPVEMVPTYMRLRKDSLPWLDQRGKELNLSRSEMIDRCVMDCRRRWEKEEKRRAQRATHNAQRPEPDPDPALRLARCALRAQIERARRELAELEETGE
jgi:hypothetical protein